MCGFLHLLVFRMSHLPLTLAPLPPTSYPHLLPYPILTSPTPHPPQAKHPTVPVVYFANGGSAYLHRQLDMAVDGLSVDWKISMAHARAVAGPKRVLAGNVDPMHLYGRYVVVEIVSNCYYCNQILSTAIYCCRCTFSSCAASLTIPAAAPDHSDDIFC